MTDSITSIIQSYDPISLSELSEYKLLNRIDTKYICNISQLPQILSSISNDFRIQTSGTERMFGYESLYFDSPQMKSYFDHHQGKRIRYKIRFRKYLDTGDVFLEIKRKKNYNRTDKKRAEFDFATKLESSHLKFIEKYIDLPQSGLQPAIWTNFNRMTLAGKNTMERVTIDTNIQFKNDAESILLPGLVVIEVKREKSKDYSALLKVLHNSHIKPYGFSKYIMGQIVLHPKIKHNRFITKISTVKQICYGTKYDNQLF
jgi:hypothetical protein